MMEYDFELDQIVEEIKKSKPNLVGLQFPEGLKDRAVDVAHEIEDRTGCSTVVFVDPTYGACDLKEETAEKLGVDLLVHFGHSEFKRR